MKVAYADCFAGAGGDMILGALLDAGLPLEQLLADLRLLGIPGWKIEAQKVARGAIGATQAIVETGEGHPHRNLAELLTLIDRAPLPAEVLDPARRILRRIAEVEAGIHREPLETVHLHELGGIDTILDVVGACAGFHRLGIEALYVSPLPLARGSIGSRHGTLPLPAPATVGLLLGAPVRVISGVEAELVTPTAAAVLTTLAAGFGDSPLMTLRAVGYGAGSRETEMPNVLRVLLGETAGAGGLISETLVTLETNIDDMPGQSLAFLIERLLEAGALDATLAPLAMKKGRPGTLVSVLCRPSDADSLTELLLRESSTLGLRRQRIERLSLPREILEVDTSFGRVRVKVAGVVSVAGTARDGGIAGAGGVAGVGGGQGRRKLSAEFDDCRALAKAKGVPLLEIERAAVAAAERVLQERKTGIAGR